MPREKEGYRLNIERLNEVFGDHDMLSIAEVAQFCGVSVSTVRRYGLKFNSLTRRISKADLARQISA